MFRYIYVGSMQLPVYGLMVILSFSVANVLLKAVCRKRNLDIVPACILEIYGGFGALVGAKLLYLFECIFIEYSIDINDFTTKEGNSFYGGMILGLLFMQIGSKIHGIDLKRYAQELAFVVPIMHSVWKMGCLCSGCCYGIETNSVIGVVYPDGAVAPSGVKLFPVQIVEVILVLVLSGILFVKNKKNKLSNPIAMYVAGYAIPRFFVEFFRYHSENRIFSLAQIISIICIIGSCVSICATKRYAGGKS